MVKVTCQITRKKVNEEDCIKIDAIRPNILEKITNNYSKISLNGYISKVEYDKFRKIYLKSILKENTKELEQEELEVFQKLYENSLISSNSKSEISEEMTTLDKLSDILSSFFGSWTFIFSFISLLVFWILLNIYVLIIKPIDPYPFIFLNLILSIIASLQGPIILMSQNQKDKKDSITNEIQYKVNLKSEIQTRILNEKVDNLTKNLIPQILEKLENK